MRKFIVENTACTEVAVGFFSVIPEAGARNSGWNP